MLSEDTAKRDLVEADCDSLSGACPAQEEKRSTITNTKQMQDIFFIISPFSTFFEDFTRIFTFGKHILCAHRSVFGLLASVYNDTVFVGKPQQNPIVDNELRHTHQSVFHFEGWLEAVLVAPYKSNWNGIAFVDITIQTIFLHR